VASGDLEGKGVVGRINALQIRVYPLVPSLYVHSLVDFVIFVVFLVRYCRRVILIMIDNGLKNWKEKIH